MSSFGAMAFYAKEAIKRCCARLPWAPRKIANAAMLAIGGRKPPFSGVYASFDEAAADGGKSYIANPDSLFSALKAARTPGPLGIPDLAAQSRNYLPLACAMIARRPLRILDFGGGCGADFARLLLASPDITAAYHVVELRETCIAGRKAWGVDDRIMFSTEMPPATAQFDIVYSWSAVQYLAHPHEMFGQFAVYNPQIIMLCHLPVADAAFARLQINRDPAFAHNVFSLKAVIETMRGHGYAIAFQGWSDDDFNVDNYPENARISRSANLAFVKLDQPSHG